MAHYAASPGLVGEVDAAIVAGGPVEKSFNQVISILMTRLERALAADPADLIR
ncbi:hypothetical protein ACQP1G_37225 [Nocardia sp. CA-107356]|uniref:hypothetical protein n=1 Tax=Nocardia sp. CA-107356 TaxID=3239972 RepID=UPI003D8ABDA1